MTWTGVDQSHSSGGVAVSHGSPSHSSRTRPWVFGVRAIMWLGGAVALVGALAVAWSVAADGLLMRPQAEFEVSWV